MAHNPPRVWFTEEDARKVRRDIDRKMAEWNTLDDLASRLELRARQGRRVVLTPETAKIVAKAIRGEI